MSTWRESWQKRFFHWLDRRMAPGRRYELRRDKLYIFPTQTGLAFAVLVVILWMLGTNYQNNLILGLCLLLASLFVLVILRTHSNLAGLNLAFQEAESGFAGQEVAFHFELENPTRRHKDSIHLAWRGEVSTLTAVDALDVNRVSVCACARERGYLRPRRLLVETVFPLGLLRCWSWLNFDAQAIIYPHPKNFQTLSPQVADGDDAAYYQSGGEDFAGLREYQAGDPLKHVAWKHYARGNELMSKEFSNGGSNEVWLRWAALEGLDIEQRLSTLCYWTLHHDRLGNAYGLDIPGTRLVPAQGAEHRHQVLKALALFGRREPVYG